MSADLIDAAVRNGAKGIVIAGVGDGNMTTPALDVLTKAAKSGVVVVRSTRLPAGIVAAQQRSQRRREGLRGIRRTESGEVARAAAACADADQRSDAHPEDVLRVLSYDRGRPRVAAPLSDALEFSAGRAASVAARVVAKAGWSAGLRSKVAAVR